MHAIRLLAFAGMITVSLCMARGSAGHDGPHAAGTQPQWPTHIYLPTPIPDRICTSFTGDPATSFSVTWRTDTSVKNSKAEIALAEGGPGFTDKAQQIAGTSQTFKSNLGEAQYHQVDFEGLAPDTRYLYRVGSDKHWSEWIQFKTASDKSARLRSFISAMHKIKSKATGHESFVKHLPTHREPRFSFMLETSLTREQAMQNGANGISPTGSSHIPFP